MGAGITQSQSFTFHKEQSSLSVPQRSNDYSKFEVFSTNLSELKSDLENRNSSVEFQFASEKTISMELTPSYILDPSFNVSYIDESGKNSHKPAHDILTLKGYTDHGEVRLTITDKYINGFMDTAEGALYIESFESSEDRDLFTLVNQNDIKDKNHKNCKHSNYFQSREDESTTTTLVSGQCYQIGLSVAADYLMVSDHGGIDNTINQIVSVMNNVQANYELSEDNFDNGIEFNLVEIVLSTCEICDPWTDSENFFDVFSSFEDWATEGGFTSQHHIGQFWTDRDFHGNVVGLAGYDSKKLSGHSRYHILQDFTANAAFLRTMTTHEIGHNLGAADLAESGSIMSGSLSDSEFWTDGTKLSINNEIVYQTDVLGVCGTNLCDPVAGLEISNITETSFSLSWNSDPSDNFDIVITNEVTEEIIFTDNISGNSMVITPEEYSICETYLVEISKNCSPIQSDKISVHFVSPINQGCADFEVGGTIQWVSRDLEFIDHSINATNWEWNFGDGNISENQDPVHNYDQAGTYAVSLSVNDGVHEKVFDNCVHVLPTVNLPYEIEHGGSFESENFHWAGETIGYPSDLWQKGIATGPLSSDDNVWKTLLSESVHNESTQSALYSPKFNFALTDEYVLSFELSMDAPVCESVFALRMEYSVDGDNWIRLGSEGDSGENIQNWYNKMKWSACPISRSVFFDQQGWALNGTDIPVSYDVSFLSGNEEVVFRYVFNTKPGIETGYDGVMIDDFRIDASAQTVVSLDLLYFEGEKEKKANELHWEAINMVNFAGFVIEKSNDGMTFDDLVMIPSEGEREMEYFYTDEEIGEAIAYYRLKMLDLDGEFSYSRILKIYNDVEAVQLAIAPNPNASGSLKINVSSEETLDQIQIFSYTGQLVLEMEYSDQIDISDLTQGTYIVNLLSQNHILDVKKLQVI